jgi:hypothetical protein
MNRNQLKNKKIVYTTLLVVLGLSVLFLAERANLLTIGSSSSVLITHEMPDTVRTDSGTTDFKLDRQFLFSVKAASKPTVTAEYQFLWAGQKRSLTVNELEKVSLESKSDVSFYSYCLTGTLVSDDFPSGTKCRIRINAGVDEKSTYITQDIRVRYYDAGPSLNGIEFNDQSYTSIAAIDGKVQVTAKLGRWSSTIHNVRLVLESTTGRGKTILKEFDVSDVPGKYIYTWDTGKVRNDTYNVLLQVDWSQTNTNYTYIFGLFTMTGGSYEGGFNLPSADILISIATIMILVVITRRRN